MWSEKEPVYQPLRDHLFFSGKTAVTMNFAEIEDVLGRPLPPSARRSSAWWSNNAKGHVQADAWLDANYRTAELDLDRQQVTFVLSMPRHGFSDAKQAIYAEAGMEPPEEVVPVPDKRLHPAFGSLRGTTIIMPGYDLTEPTYKLLDQPDGP
jgi:hypothetical protein